MTAPAFGATLTHGDRFREVLASVTYKDWSFRIGGEPGRWWLQVAFPAPDVGGDDRGAQAIQCGRKWLLSEYTTDSEVVQTAFKAVLSAEEHEAREQFKLGGIAVLGPHFDLHVLAALHHNGVLGLAVRP